MSDNLLLMVDNGKIAGRIRTMTLNFPVEMVPTGGTGNKPSHEIYSNGVKIGAAWGKTMRETGEVFYSLTMDDPSFPATLNMSAFPSKKVPSGFEVVWSRPRQPAREAA